MPATRLLVVDDHPVVVEGLARLLRLEGDLRVEWVAFNVSEATRICQTNAPDLAIVDISLEDGSGIDLIRTMHTLRPSMPILALSMRAALNGKQALRSETRGAAQTMPRIIVQAIRRARESSAFFAQDAILGKQPQSTLNIELPPKLSLQQLSDRERDVFNLIGEGLRKREIAERLGLSVNTVETHRAGIKKKLKFRSAAELARFAYLRSQGC